MLWFHVSEDFVLGSNFKFSLQIFFFPLVARTRHTGSQAPDCRVSHENPTSSCTPGCYAWVDDGVRDVNSIVSEDAVAAYIASVLEPPAFELVHPTMEARVCDRPGLDSAKDWFYVHDYCLTTLRVQMPFSSFKIRLLNTFVLV
ncbi:mycothione reductase [Sesbania bispinosa]|nr:mycothione reductase [Sesbania bispinosa]KAJ1398743.1 mycothione reductase [Sesbania bispinosa]